MSQLFDQAIVVRDWHPLSQRSQVVVDGVRVDGIVWPEARLRDKRGAPVVFRDWAEEYFGSGNIFELAAAENLDAAHTERDIRMVGELLGRLQSPLVDVGAGSGRHLRRWLAEGIGCFGIEPSEPARKAAIEAKLPMFPDLPTAAAAGLMGRARVAVRLFNSFGYTFRRADDEQALAGMAALLEPGGALIVDVRAEEYQRKKFAQPVETEQPLAGTRARLITRKLWRKEMLAAEERVVTPDGLLVHQVTFGWNTYSRSEWRKLFAQAGVELVAERLDYYSGEHGERLWLLGRKRG